MRDQGSINIDDFKGLYSRGKDDACPEDHFSDGQNFDFDEEDVITRDGMGVVYSTVSNGIDQAYYIQLANVRCFIYLGANHLYFYDGSVTYDLATISASRFDIAKLYNRYYITPTSYYGALQGAYTYVVMLGKVATVNIGIAGTGYTVGDILTLVSSSGDANAKVRVLTVGGAGDITSVLLVAPGTHYKAGLLCDALGGTGTGAAINSTTVTQSCNKAAGFPPSGFTTTIAAGAAGKCDAGRRLIAVAYETDTGFITAPGPVSWSLFNLAPGQKKISLSNLPVNGEVVTVAVSNGGAGYTLNDILTLVGTSGVVSTVKATTVAAGVVTAVTLQATGSGYTTGVKATTGGTGAGCTINITAIVSLPSNVIARHILVSKVIFNYNAANFNQLEHELFFVAGGKIEDVLTDTLTLDYYDSELLSSADYLIDQLSEIPGGACLEVYGDRLCIGGEFIYPNTIRASNIGSPESMNSTNGFKTIAPDDSMGQESFGTGVKNLKVLRGALYIWKNSKTYAIQDNGSEASSWIAPTLIDAGIGCGNCGVGTVLNNSGASTDYLLVATQSGLKLFNGSYIERDLTYKIKGLWQRGAVYGGIPFSFVIVDSLNKKIYVNISDSISSYLPKIILVGNYENGLDWQSIRWSVWKIPKDPYCIFLGLKNALTSSPASYSLYVTDRTDAASGNIYIFDPSYTGDYTAANNDTAIDSYVKTSLLTFEASGGLNLFAALRMRAMGSGSLAVTLAGEDNSNPITPNGSPLTLAASPGKELRLLLNYISERMSIKLRTNAIGSYFRLIRASIFGQPIYDERPL